MKTLIFTLITLSFTLSHAGRLDHYYRGIASDSNTEFRKEIKEAFKSGNMREKLNEIAENHKKDFEAKIRQGMTPLIRVSQKGDVKSVKEILDIGADINAQDKYYDMTALMHASAYGHKDVVNILTNRGADINAQDKHYGMTALMHASAYGHKDVVNILTNRGADINAKNKYGKTPLMHASAYGHKDVVNILTNRGAKRQNEMISAEDLLKLEGLSWEEFRNAVDLRGQLEKRRQKECESQFWFYLGEGEVKACWFIERVIPKIFPNARKNPHPEIPNEMPEKAEDLVEMTRGFGHFVQIIARMKLEKEELSIRKTEQEKRNLQYEKILEDLEVKNPKNKKEIADYLNSLTSEKLMELHNLRIKINEESSKMVQRFGYGLFAAGIPAAAITSDLRDEAKLKSKRTLFKWMSRTSLGVVSLGALALAYGTYKTYQVEGLGLDAENARSVKEKFKDYINSLTLEEAREVLSDIKNINEKLKKETK